MVSLFRPDIFRNRVALITGGGTGICRGIALAFAAHGADVAILGRQLDRLESTAAGIRAFGVRAFPATADVRDPAAVAAAVAECADELGRLDIVVNGAAGNFVCRAEDLSANGFAAVVDIDLKGTFHVCKAVQPFLRRQGGSIVNISATLHYLGTVAQLHVSAAKAGVDALTRTLAVEWGPYGIRVNGLAPGPIAGTEGVRRLLGGSKTERTLRLNPLRRLGEIADVEQAALFLCSDAASFVNGVTLAVDGGGWLASYRVCGEPE